MAISPSRIRFYGVGEYSDAWRPHYHVILFGFQSCLRGQTLQHAGTKECLWSECCDRCRLVGRTWGQGIVQLGTVTSDSASYVAEYCVKKMTKADDPRLEGRFPEFSRQSNKNGGIGSEAMWDVASDMLRMSLDEILVDVPSALKHGAANAPLGRYLKEGLRLMIGRQVGAPQAVLDKISSELLPLREFARRSAVSPSFRQAIVDFNEGSRSLLEARSSLYKKGRRL